jgi:glycosyltransferase involved in cell wall biosynthesis
LAKSKGRGKGSDVKLVLFFTYGLSLDRWSRAGILERELALYRKLAQKGISVHLVSYGRIRELRYKCNTKGMRLWANLLYLPNRLYAGLVARGASRIWLDKAIFKSNQMDGAEFALKASMRCGAPFVARLGYLPSLFLALEEGWESSRVLTAKRREEAVLQRASKVVVTTEELKERIIREYGIDGNKLEIIPNFVQTGLFTPGPDEKRARGRICFVGRLHRQKNPSLLIDSVRGMDVELLIVGEGPLRDKLKQQAQKEGVRAEFLGMVPNVQLPMVLNSCGIFVMPSLYEGHPKALLEAMSCGMAVVGTKVPGIRELIRDRETGLLCEPEASHLREAFKELLSDRNLRTKLGRAARQFIIENFELDRVAEMEFNLLSSLSSAQ